MSRAGRQAGSYPQAPQAASNPANRTPRGADGSRRAKAGLRASTSRSGGLWRRYVRGATQANCVAGSGLGRARRLRLRSRPGVGQRTMAESNHKTPSSLAVALLLAVTTTALAYARGFFEQDLDKFRGLSSEALLASSLRFKFVPIVRRESPTYVFVVKETVGVAQDTVSQGEVEATRLFSSELEFPLEPPEMERLLDAARTCDAVRRPSMSADSLFFVDVRVEDPGKPIRYRTPLTTDEMKLLWRDFLSTTSQPSALRRVLVRYGFAMGFTEGSQLHDRSDQVRVEFSGFRPVRGADEYVGTVTVTSAADSALPAPVSLVLWPLYVGAELVGPPPSGYTLAWDRAYFDLPVGDMLEPGEAVTLNVRYMSRGHMKMEFRYEVYAGAGER